MQEPVCGITLGLRLGKTVSKSIATATRLRGEKVVLSLTTSIVRRLKGTVLLPQTLHIYPSPSWQALLTTGHRNYVLVIELKADFESPARRVLVDVGLKNSRRHTHDSLLLHAFHERLDMPIEAIGSKGRPYTGEAVGFDLKEPTCGVNLLGDDATVQLRGNVTPSPYVIVS